MGGSREGCLTCYLALLLLTTTSAARCLAGPEILPKRHLYFNGESVPIVIEASDRPAHHIISHVLQILLEEVVGYAKVEIHGPYNDINTSHILNRLGGCYPSGCRNAHGMIIPETMINLEVWSRAGFNMESWTRNQYVKDLGPLGPSGRFGWFMPSDSVEENWKAGNHIIDHWRALKRQEITSQFALKDKRDLLETFLSYRNIERKESFCQDPHCKHGILFQNHCLSKKKDCAVLLASDPTVSQGMLKNQIKNLKLDVVVSWIGSHLQSFVHQQSARGIPTLFFDFEPNVLTSVGNYSRVSLPPCLKHGFHNDTCDFDIHQLSKVIWNKLETHAPEAAHVVSNMRLTQTEYEKLIKLLVDRMGSLDFNTPTYDEFHDTACQWVRENARKWTEWIPYLSKKLRIYLGGMFPLTGPYWRQPGIVPGAQMAVEVINKMNNILRDYELVLLIQDTQCKVDIVMKQFMYYIVNETHPIAGILGPGCSETAEPIAGVSKHFNVISVSYSAEALQLGNRAMFPFFFRTLPPVSQYSRVYVDMFQMFGWSQVALLAEDGQEYPEFHTYLKDVFINNDIDVVYDRKMPRQSTSEDAIKYIEELLETEAKIIIMTSMEMSARSVICQAYKKGMTRANGYVWFLPMWFTVNWWVTDHFNRQVASFINVPCRTHEMYDAIQGHFGFSSAIFGAEESHIVGNITVREWKTIYKQRLSILGLRNWESSYASFAYDAVWVFALGLDRLLSEDPSALESWRTDHTTQRLMSHLNNTHFQGVSGPVQFNGADRTGIINIYQHQGNATIEIGQYHHEMNRSLQLNLSTIVWPVEGIPSDGRPLPKRCSIEGFRAMLKVSCDQAIVVANVIGVSCFVIFMFICLVIVKKRYDDKVRATRERMEELGLMADASWLCLDQWEIPRGRVVLNRKLGEGAFGTVYGGETLLDDVWVAVAVKTLKIGSTPEDKLEFLSEAEMMKRFEHENIIKLVGVCTRGEPAYAIMEFMLHGDLKTFLLARRQLVGLQTREAEEVSPLALTKMALDVAYGLEYLSDLKYVHRDLACRNCLVNASKTVKIGDFGMTRPMYDSDYYRFNKRGMLPVRWMAPESLSDGLFTPMTDVWSYGVLLYEIITFGSFPYQGMANKQVLHYVKNGSRIHPPNSCPENLRNFLISCWSFDPESRPSVRQIISMLQVHPELLVPSLDTPGSAVLPDPSCETLDLDIIVPRPPRSARKSNAHAMSEHFSEHFHLKGFSFGDSDKKSSTGVPPDPFSILGPKTERTVAPTVIRSPMQTTEEEDKEARMSMLSDNDMIHEWDTSCAQLPEDEAELSGASFNSERGIPMRAVVANHTAASHHHHHHHHDERNDSDYSSDHSKDIIAQGQLNLSSAV